MVSIYSELKENEKRNAALAIIRASIPCSVHTWLDFGINYTVLELLSLGATIY